MRHFPLYAQNGHVGVDAIRVEDGVAKPIHEKVASEVPVALVFNRFPFSVIMASPRELDDLIVGFSLTEGLVADAGEISAVEVVGADEGAEVHATLTADAYLALRERHRRSFLVGTSCGLCGTDSIDDAMRPLDPVRSTADFAPAALVRAMAELPLHQPLNRELGSVHAAGFAAADGGLLAVREDVGRHNALDKLIGHLARRGVDCGQGFVVVSSRCSYEMVHKAAARGIPLIAAVSAATSQAVRLAADTGVGLASFVREGRFTLYATASRIRL